MQPPSPQHRKHECHMADAGCRLRGGGREAGAHWALKDGGQQGRREDHARAWGSGASQSWARWEGERRRADGGWLVWLGGWLCSDAARLSFILMLL